MMKKTHNNNCDSDQKKTTYENKKLPKNLRQVGQVSDKKRIYIEDYVMTYIKQMAMNNNGTYQAAVLLGENQLYENIDTIFISGAVEVKDISFEDGKVFDNEAWTQIYGDIKKYFNKIEVVGWYLTSPGLTLELNERVKTIHKDNFAGNDKVLLMYDSSEREEVFYLYEDSRLEKQDGYYIYYEKNEAMQSYMIDQKENKSVENSYVDQAGINIRNVLERKEAKGEKEEKTSSLRYAAASVAALFLLIVAATLLSGVNVGKDKSTNSKKISVAEVTNVPEVSSTEDATTVNVQVGDKTTIKGEDDTGDETLTTPEAITSAEPKESTAPTETAAPVQAGDNEGVDVVIDGTSPLPDKTTAPTQEPAKETTVDTETKVHTVIKGETLGSISLKYYKTKDYIKKIMELNNIEDADKIYEGQKLKLPSD